MKSKSFFLTVVIVTLLIFNIYSEDNTSAKSENHIGFIFSTDNLLMNINDYNGGIGIKMMFPKLSARFLVDFGYSKSTGIFSTDLGFTLEKRMREGRIVPYLGGGFKAGINREKVELDIDNWTKQISIPLEASANLGVEVFLLEFLSFFAEYSLAFQLIAVNTKESINGTVTSDTTWTWDLSTGLGNSGRLGIIIYLDDVIKIEKK